MDGRSGTDVVAGIFRDESDAAAAVRQLVDEYFLLRNDLRVIASRHHQREDVLVWENPPVERGGVIGAAIGTVLAATGVALAGLTTGPFTMAALGPVVAALEGAFMGGCLGYALGTLIAIEVADLGADFSRSRIHGGVVWVGVRARGVRARRALEILSRAGAQHFVGREAEPVGMGAPAAA